MLWNQRTEGGGQSWKDTSHSDIWDSERKHKSCSFVFLLKLITRQPRKRQNGWSERKREGWVRKREKERDMEGKESKRKKMEHLFYAHHVSKYSSILQKNASFLSYSFPAGLPKRAIQRAWSATNPISPILPDDTRGRLDAGLQGSSVFFDVILSPFVEKGRGCYLFLKPEKKWGGPR